MEAHIFFFCTSTILTISFFLIISLPKSYSENHDDAYHECGRPYNCGTIQMPNGAYPFWTDDRPRYCGSTDGLKLNCSENHSVSFEVGTQIFNVTQINQEHHILTVVRADVDYDNCSSDLTNVSFSLTSQINLSIFGSVKNVTLFYDCPSSISGLNKFPCKAPSNSNIYYAFENDAEYGVLRSQCGRLIQVPISSDGIDLNIAQDGIVVLNRGFDVTYMSVDESPCLNCAYSRGICGSGIDNSSQFTCFCEDGPQNSECHHHHRSTTKSRVKAEVLNFLFRVSGGKAIA
ncbi:LEAF RUST 10 DISEASE-RESISTANCE LOCUS RECEPTOR-LIKE PROTEIN KINASE-like 2.1 [Senna tora]|uniref:non-specific serine/threonine protein kinase n=1 Tax=Senna tora TaxID=362788 RepID=A0A834TF18_9FABA|nr:LEAF RUST 10 DISEASE-RESISTANCE LOCUS RECEPTOR-LIKE PROTEIN KINASE-like 2.1 [Senna tora]